MNKATIYNLARMCNNFNFNCSECPLHLSAREMCLGCGEFIIDLTDKANEIILKWCEKHPVETRQGRLLKLFPNANILCETVDICPRKIDKTTICDVRKIPCPECKRKYWLTEVDE